jgi:hypothetical protein
MDAKDEGGRGLVTWEMGEEKRRPTYIYFLLKTSAQAAGLLQLTGYT